MRKFIFSILALMLILVSCGEKESKIQGVFLGGVEFGQNKQEVLSTLFKQGFVDVNTAQQDANFEKYPLGNNSYSEMKQLAVPDSMGFMFLNRNWLKVQVEFAPNKGLYSIKFYSGFGTKAQIEQAYFSCLSSLEKYYDMQRSTVGTMTQDGKKPIEIKGYSFEDNGRIVQMHINDEVDSISSYTLTYTQEVQ